MHPFELALNHTLQPQTLRQLDAAGVDRNDLRRPSWRHSSHGLWVPSYRGAPEGTAQRIAEALPLVPDHGALAGWAAAYVHGVTSYDGRDPHTGAVLPVVVALGRNVGRSQYGTVRFVRDRLPAEDLEPLAGTTVTTPLRTAFDLGRTAVNLSESVVAVDAFLAAAAVDLEELRRRARLSPGWRGIPVLRRAVELARTGVESPWESRIRILAEVELGFTGLDVNPTLTDRAGRFMARPDLFDEEAALAIEFDGADHRGRERHHADNHREERLEHLNVVVARVDSLDFRRRTELGERIDAARQRGLRRNRRLDRWLLAPSASPDCAER